MKKLTDDPEFNAEIVKNEAEFDQIAAGFKVAFLEDCVMLVERGYLPPTMVPRLVEGVKKLDDAEALLIATAGGRLDKMRKKS